MFQTQAYIKKKFNSEKETYSRGKYFRQNATKFNENWKSIRITQFDEFFCCDKQKQLINVADVLLPTFFQKFTFVNYFSRMIEKFCSEVFLSAEPTSHKNRGLNVESLLQNVISLEIGTATRRKAEKKVEVKRSWKRSVLGAGNASEKI